MSSTVTWPEIIWTCTAIAGFAVCYWALYDAIADRNYLHALGLNGAREIVAGASIRTEALQVIIQAIFTAIGIAAMVTAPADPGQSVTPLSVIVAGGLIVAAVLLVVKALFDRRDRQRVIELLSDKDTSS